MAKEYFSDLNYTLANEDTHVEWDLLRDKARHVFCISGSGARAFPLIGKNPAKLDVVDMSPSQLHLCELRVEAARSLSYEEWLFFFGYRGGLQRGGQLKGDSRKQLFEEIKGLSPATRTYWAERVDGWAPRGFIYLGKWESHFLKLSHLFRNVLKFDFTPIFEAQSLEEQIELYAEHFPAKRFTTFLTIVANQWVFNKFLYKGHFAGTEGKKTESRSPSKFIDEEFHRLFHSQLARKSYFLQMLFLGKVVYEEGLPLDAQQHVFDAVKKSTTEIRYRPGNLLEILPTEPYDFISLSDTISYLDPADANSVLQKMHAQSAMGTTMVIRSFMRAPTEMNSAGWEELTDAQSRAYETDCTGVYQFHIYRKK